MGELKLCPFCGNDGELNYVRYIEMWTVCCSNNECPMHPYESFESGDEAEKAWNTRWTPGVHDVDEYYKEIEEDDEHTKDTET